MAFLSNIRQQIGNYQFLKRLARTQHKRQMHSLREAKYVGVLYDASEDRDYKMVAEFVKNLQNDGKTVKALGYINYNIIPHYCIPKLSFDYFLKKEVNMWFIPKNVFVDDFIKTEFDVVIDLTLKDFFPIQYISGLSQAHFKVGRAGDDNLDYYDFMIKINEKTTLPMYMKEIVNYLNMLEAK